MAVVVSDRFHNFSTLVRANVSATAWNCWIYYRVRIFQYPRSGQCLCNNPCHAVSLIPYGNFSTLVRANVSATTPTDEAYGRDQVHFSTLVRANVSATYKKYNALEKKCIISVPSFGPMCLQRPPVMSRAWRVAPFQYPRSGQCVCNLSENRLLTSSIRYFSTLVRANVSATLPRDEKSGKCFSIFGETDPFSWL